MKKKVKIVGLLIGAIIGQLVWGGGVNADDEAGILPDVTEETVSDKLPELYIKAINPGYKIDDVSNVGEMIEIARRETTDGPILLAGTTVSYTNSSGVQTVLLEFPEGSWMTGESILLRLASSPGHELAAMTYTVKGSSAGIGQTAGPLTLTVDGEVMDTVCWTGAEGCERKFKSGSGEVLVRNVETGEWEFQIGYEPEYFPDSYYVEPAASNADEAEEGYGSEARSQCRGLKFSEILSYYETAKTEQFIEIYNSTVEQILLDGCSVRYKNKNYALSGVVVAEGYLAYHPVGFSLTKNPTNVNRLEIIDTDDVVVDVMEYPNGQKKGSAYAMIGYDANGEELWRTTYAVTPGAPNIFQEFKTCEAGKVINEETGNCVKATTVNQKVCAAGYFLNESTGRCKKVTVTTEKICPEGYYLNEETNRCRKIKENNGANYEITAEKYDEKSSFVALYAVLGVLAVGIGYLVYEFRHEIAGRLRWAREKMGRWWQRKR